VGLGKTIEAGLVLAGLRQIGLADRVLVAAPEHLCFQWLAELFHKFNALFTLLTEGRVAALGGPEAALARSPLAVVALERLREDPDLAEACCEAEPDLLVVDEAHHLAEDALHAAVAPIAREAFGLLLLTATPVRLDPREYWRLLGLVEPVPSTSLEAFLARLERHEAFADVARGLLSGGPVDEALERLRALAPGDPFVRQGPGQDRGALLDRLADRHGLSSRLIRNRRARVGAFTRRLLRRQEVPAGGKREAAAALLARLTGAGEKVLCVGADAEALGELREAMARRGLEALLYDDAEGIEARDRLVARFRDPDGPRILLTGESGGEGRNFQFASHLVCYDLPTSPLALEQRIGRLDRLGQHRPVEIHLLPEPEERFLADLYEREIGIFDEPVGGLDAVLASLPRELELLQGAPQARHQAFREALAARVAAARRAQREGYDPLLDIRSASLPELAGLVERATGRMEGGEGVATATPPAEGIREGLSRLSRWLEEELEEVCVEVARRAGIDVDTDRNVGAFEAAFTLGARMRIDALPGMSVPEEPTTVLGSFWRETAVPREELDWLGTGHRLVEALLGLVRDGDAGRVGRLRVPGAPAAGALLCRFAVLLPQPADLEPGSRVPSRQASRYLDESPLSLAAALDRGHAVIPGLAERAEAGQAADAQGPAGGAGASALEGAFRAARAAAEERLAARRAAAVERLRRHAEAEAERLEEAQEAGASRQAVDQALAALDAHRGATEEALRRARIEIDAVAVAWG
jgi:ATP-dependent helicase HepA